jgi:hypothetical protein
MWGIPGQHCVSVSMLWVFLPQKWISTHLPGRQSCDERLKNVKCPGIGTNEQTILIYVSVFQVGLCQMIMLLRDISQVFYLVD